MFTIDPLRPALACLLVSLLAACHGDTSNILPASTSSSSGSSSGGPTTSSSGGPTTSSSDSPTTSSSGDSSTSSSSGDGAESSSSSSSGDGAESSSSSGGDDTDGGGATGKVVMFEDFDNVSAMSISDSNDHTQPSGFGMGAQGGGIIHFETDPAQTYGGKGKSLRASYPVPNGESYAWGGIGLEEYNTDNIYVRFRAKMPGNRHGLKFLKVFGQDVNGAGYANTTFGLDYTGVDNGSMYAISFGDGTELTNDTANLVFMDGSNPEWAGRSYGLTGNSITTPQGKAFASTDWGSEWHLFELHVKFNSGTSEANEKNDGEIFVRIDGEVYMDAKGLFNRNHLNKAIGSVHVLGWSQTGALPFDIWYDNIEISIDGWGNSPV